MTDPIQNPITKTPPHSGRAHALVNFGPAHNPNAKPDPALAASKLRAHMADVTDEALRIAVTEEVDRRLAEANGDGANDWLRMGEAVSMLAWAAIPPESV